MKKTLFFLAIITVFLLLPEFMQIANAQPPPPDPEQIPIDGGLSFLIIAGAVYGAIKLRKNKGTEYISNK